MKSRKKIKKINYPDLTKKITEEKIENKSSEKKWHKRFLPVLISFFAGFLLNLIIVSAYFSWMAKHSESPAKKTSSEKSVDLPAPSSSASAPAVSVSPASVPKAVSLGATYAFSGTVVSVEGNIVTVDMFRCGEGHRTYKMLVKGNTVIIKREKEQENPASLADIKENYNVAVESFEDIKNKDSFEAKKIMLMSQNSLSPSN